MKPKAEAASTWKLNTVFVLAVGFLTLVALNPAILSMRWLPGPEGIHILKSMLISIVLEAMPFLLLGVAVSSLIQVFVPESWVRRVIPRNPVLGVVAACLLGIVFPVCECGLIPIVRRLIAKGMPLYAGVAFIVTGPIVNPVVYAATFAAFRTRPEIAYARMGLAVAVGLAIGLLVYFFIKRNPLKNAAAEGTAEHRHEHGHRTPGGRGRLEEATKHAGDEFFEMGKYLILGSLITACIQAFVPRQELLGIGQGEFGSHLFMMGFAYILSLCSTSDAFVASSFVGTFSAGSLLAFLVFGPMIDFKGTLMMLAVFKARFVLFVGIAAAVVVLVGSLAVGRFYL